MTTTIQTLSVDLGDGRMATIQLTINVPALVPAVAGISSPDGTEFTIDAGTSRVIPLEAVDQFGRPLTGVSYVPGATNNAQVTVMGGTDQIEVAVDLAAGQDGISGLVLTVSDAREQ